MNNIKFLRSLTLNVLLGLLLSTSCGRSNPHPQQSTLRSVQSAQVHGIDFNVNSSEELETYQIGTEFGKAPVNAARLGLESEVFQRAAKATARVGGATGFYLGKFDDKHIVATNHHVLENAWYCMGLKITFTLLNGRQFQCVDFLGSWPSIDLALFVIEVKNASDEARLAEVAANFAFDADIYPGQELLTVGYGIADNARRLPMANQDSDCKVFSGFNEFRLLADPDELNPGPYKSWSFANGCDVSHGDSGSAMVDRQTGEVIGIIWTGRIPKDEEVRDAAFLQDIFDNQNEAIWEMLSFAVPAAKMKLHLEGLLNDTDVSEEHRNILRSILSL